jgi:type IV fimbrial biogenesis protein FimT
MHSRGFSLIELIITIVVLMSVSMLAIPAFQSSIGNSQIRTVAESIKNGLQQARMEAIKRNTRIKFTLGADSSWQFGCEVVTAICPATIARKSASEGSSGGISVVADSRTAIFNGFGSREPIVQARLARVDVTNSQVNQNERRALSVLLNAGGNTKLCDPKAPIGDIRAC